MIAFTDIVGMAQAKQALLLLAVDPQLGGVVIPAPVGAGKSTLARAFAEVLPEQTPFVELPLNVTEDRLLGGVDLEATLASGRRVVQRGVLAKAHGGLLYVDSLSLLDSSAVAHVMDALSRGEVLVEREGLSEVHPARFMLLGTYDPSDGEVRMGLLDRIGLIVPHSAQRDSEARARVVRCVRASERRTQAQRDGEELAMLRALLAQARARLSQVQISEVQLQTLARAALAFGVEGNRADVFAVRAALASAALKQRDEVTDEDLQTAVRLVLIPRATQQPAPDEVEELLQEPPQAPQPAHSDEQADAADDPTSDDAPEPPPEAPAEQTPDEDEGEAEEPPAPSAAEEPGFEEILLEAEATPMPEDILQVSLAVGKRSAAGSRGEALNDRRGRFVRAQPGSLRSGKVALIPTLLAAAPWQASRQAEASTKDTQQMAQQKTRRLQIRRDDVRVKRFRDKSGTLFVFMVDASGSMALNRMRQAKGAVASLLQNAYVNRDQVALIAFRGQRAEVLLPPSQSVDRAKRELDVLPTGGGTPLASALYSGLQLAAQVRSKGIHQIHFVLITDGRANVGLQAALPGQAESDPGAGPTREMLAEEVQQLARAVALDGISSIVVDTQMRHLSRGEAERLAERLGGRYFYLPNAGAEQIVAAALSA